MTTASPARALTPASRPWRVLVVDADRWQRNGIATALNERGCDVTEARSVGAAQVTLGNRTFDAVVTSLCLGDGDGFAVFQAVRRVGQPIPVMVVTGVSTATGTASARTLWFSNQPVTERGLFEAIHDSCQENARRVQRRESRATLPVFIAAAPH